MEPGATSSGADGGRTDHADDGGRGSQEAGGEGDESHESRPLEVAKPLPELGIRWGSEVDAVGPRQGVQSSSLGSRSAPSHPTSSDLSAPTPDTKRTNTIRALIGSRGNGRGFPFPLSSRVTEKDSGDKGYQRGLVLLLA